MLEVQRQPLKFENSFHAHIYFDALSRGSAEKLQQLLRDQLAGKVHRVSRMVDHPIGPHPVGMFEVDFAPSQFDEAVKFLMLHHGELSVLIHPQTGDDLTDHTRHALWLGKQLELDLTKL